MDLQAYTHFSGSASDLAAMAIACAQDLGLPVDPDKTNERLVRYYVSAGVVDRPDRVGRDAAYGYRHLLQLLTARRMVQAGTALSVVAPHNTTSTTKALEEGLRQPLPTAAQLLVGSFMGAKMSAKSERLPVSAAASIPNFLASSRPTKPPPTPGPSIVDVLDEVRDMRTQWMAELAQIKTLRHEIDALREGVERSLSMARQAMDYAESTHAQMRHVAEHLERHIDRVTERLSDQNDAVLKGLDKLLKRVPAPKPDEPDAEAASDTKRIQDAHHDQDPTPPIHSTRQGG